jgi:hypothetical protein
MGCSAVPAIALVVLSAAMLVWVAGKTGNAYQKLGKVVGWVSLVAAIVIALWSVVMCASKCMGDGGCPMMGKQKGKAHMEMMQGMPQHMGPGMGMGRGMSTMPMPPAPPPAQQ